MISVSSKFRFFYLLFFFPNLKLLKDRIKWHQFSLSAAWSQVVVYLFRTVFMTPCGLLYCLNMTQFVHSRIGIWGKLSFMVSGDDSAWMLSWGQTELLSFSGCGGQRTFSVGGSALQLFTRMFSSPENLTLYTRVPIKYTFSLVL